MYSKARQKRWSFFRKVARGIWNDAGDPTVYGIFEFDISKIQPYLQQNNIQLFTYVLAAMGKTFEKHPYLNCYSAWGRLVERDSIDFSIMIHIPHRGLRSNVDLSIQKVPNVPQRSLKDLDHQIKQTASKIRRDPQIGMRYAHTLITWAPQFLVKLIFEVYGFLVFNLRLNPHFLGLPSEPYGACIFTNLQAFDVDCGLIPLVPTTRAPMMVSVGRVKEKPWVEGGQVCVRPVVTIGFSFDHRYMDGYQAGRMIKTLKKYFVSTEHFY